MTEPFLIRRKGKVSDGAGGFLEAVAGQDTGIKLLLDVKQRKGDYTSEGFKPHLKQRLSLTGYMPTDFTLKVGDLIEGRGLTFGLVAPPFPSDDRLKTTLEVEQL